MVVAKLKFFQMIFLFLLLPMAPDKDFYDCVRVSKYTSKGSNSAIFSSPEWS